MIANYSKKDIVEALKEIGIEKGEDLFIHSNLGYYGMLEGCRCADDLCKIFIEAMTEVIGENGTIICPTFSYSYCHNELYDPVNTKTTCGMLSEYMIRNYPENRTLDPNFSVCGTGRNMKEYLTCNIHESFGKNSFWELFMNNNGKIVCMNFDAGSTFVHFIERQNNVAYRYNKAFNGQTILNGKMFRDYAVHYVFDGEDDYPCMERVDELCKENGISHTTNLGKGTILCSSSKEYYDFFSNLLKKRPRVLCKTENPN